MRGEAPLRTDRRADDAGATCAGAVRALAKRAGGAALGALLLLSAGCFWPQRPGYAFRTNLPWPDQYVMGERSPDRRAWPLSEPTERWHRARSMDDLLVRLRKLTLRYPGSLLLARRGLAVPENDVEDAERALPYVEARVISVPYPVGGPRGALQWEERPGSLADCVERCAEAMGIHVLWDRSVSGARPPAQTPPPLPAGEALALMLLDADLYVEPVLLGAAVLRSYEHVSEQEFAAAVEAEMQRVESLRPGGPFTVIPLTEWTARNDAALRQMGWTDGEMPEGRRVQSVRRHLRRLVELRTQPVAPVAPAAVPTAQPDSGAKPEPKPRTAAPTSRPAPAAPATQPAVRRGARPVPQREAPPPGTRRVRKAPIVGREGDQREQEGASAGEQGTEEEE